MSDVRLRFAPSPTGYLHIGGLRTALYNFLYAKQNGGKFLLRIEDTDRTRYVEGAIENLLHELSWAGITVDEGVVLDEEGKPVSKGDCKPYIQSERVEKGIYNKYIDKLLEEDKAYYCFCTQERLDKLREQQKADGKVPRYDGLCRGISLEEAKKRVAAGESHVIRMKLPANKDITFHDAIKGNVTINTNDMDDQVLIKSDGFPTYHFAVVVDDHEMGITHVVRGDEWLPSTPKHVYLYEAFGWEAPEYVHLPTVLSKSGKKLSKRTGDVSVGDFREMGYLPEGLINYLALVGWSPETNEEILSLDELIKQFSFDRVSKSGGVFDKEKLDWVNGHYIRAMEIPELAEKVKPYLVKAGFISEDISKDKLELITLTFQESISKLSDIVEQSEFLFADKIEIVEEDAKEMASGEQVPALIEAFKNELEQVDEIDEEFAKTVMKRIQKATGVKGKNLFMPVRAILTGNVHGPELVHVIQILGKDGILKRLNDFQIA
ncbi:glutamate--tRNA ligase [Miniphocaeibacter halophilus]|uniref:Glutamate--tRNA ligase n=1 Tax=Miniphocaeibacter halophilus TaxID=2931922 RepID=A0AC61MS98_9FIRM|nr:glutamate--tRNA ligase [Miniphocaeibacter halophilus]QQK08529.1 glutamate--tRNA ligase [Miniphocaeibacter halophilus]